MRRPGVAGEVQVYTHVSVARLKEIDAKAHPRAKKNASHGK